MVRGKKAESLPRDVEKPKKTRKRKVGRPKKRASAKTVRLLAAQGFTQEGAARVLGMHRDTLRANFSAAFEEGREILKNDILVKQVEVAIKKGDASMLRWLGVQRCGQTSKTQVTGKDGGALQVEIGSPAENERRVAELLAKAQANGGTNQPVSSES